MEKTPAGKVEKTSSPQMLQENKTSTKVVKRVTLSASYEILSKNATGVASHTEHIHGEILKVAKIALSKGGPALVRRNGILLEAIPLKTEKKCGTILVKVKERKSKAEKDYVVSLCGKKVEINSR